MIKEYLYTFSGGANYRVTFFIFLALYIFTYSDLFKKIEPDEINRECLRKFLRFFMRIYFCEFLYFAILAVYRETFTVYMLHFYAICYWLQIKYKFTSPDNFMTFTCYLLFYYLFIEIYTHEPLYKKF